MSVLYWFESIRTPFLTTLMDLVTRLGEETIIVVLALLFLWCLDKYEGYYLLTVGFAGMLASQFLKILCRIPRPWVKDPSFTIVESAREEATGYSFPSGHSQNAVGAFGSVAAWQKQKVVRILAILFCVLVPVSRMYLGVHTPADVLVGSGISLVFLFAFLPVFRTLKEHPRRFYILLGSFFLLSLAYVFYLELGSFPSETADELANLHSAMENAYKLIGSLLGLTVMYLLDHKLWKYETRAPWLAQILKLILGAVVVMGVKILLKSPLLALTGGHASAGAIRYFLMFAVGGACPGLFPYITRVSLFIMQKCKRTKA